MATDPRALVQRWLRWGLGLGLGLGLGWLAVRGLDLGQIAAELATAEPTALVLAFSLGWGGYRLRAVRWRWLLEGGLRRQGLRESFGILILGYFLNNLLPARAGELARVALMGRINGVPAAGTLATIVAERVMDGFVLGLAGWWALERALGLDLPWLRALALAFALLLVLLSLAARLQRRLLEWVRQRASSAAWLARPVRHAGELLDHLGGVARAPDWARIFALTLLVWSLEACLYACVAASFRVTLDGAQLAGFVAVVNFASLIPTPGGLGAVELAGASVLAQSGVARESAFVLVSVQHALQYLLCAVFGLWHMARLGLLGRPSVGLIRARDSGSA